MVQGTGVTGFTGFDGSELGDRKIGGYSGRGFSFNFDTRLSPSMFGRMMNGEALTIRSASIEAVVTTTNEVKLRIRNYITAHFTGSEMHGNNQRRVANAASQSKFYDDLDKGQYTGLVYSKFGAGVGGAGFVDFLLLHVRGGTVKPKSGNWLRIPNYREFGSQVRQTGFFPISKSSVFFAKSDDGRKLFLLRREQKKDQLGNRRAVLLATLVPSLAFPARLSGITEILRRAGDTLQSNLIDELDSHQGRG